MALRKIVTKEDPILRKVCKPVEVFDEKLARLIDDMMQTLKKSAGSGFSCTTGWISQKNFYYGSWRRND